MELINLIFWSFKFVTLNFVINSTETRKFLKEKRDLSEIVSLSIDHALCEGLNQPLTFSPVCSSRRTFSSVSRVTVCSRLVPSWRLPGAFASNYTRPSILLRFLGQNVRFSRIPQTLYLRNFNSSFFFFSFDLWSPVLAFPRNLLVRVPSRYLATR